MEIIFLNYSNEKHPLDYSVYEIPSLENSLPAEILSSKGFLGDLLFMSPIDGSFNGGFINSFQLFYSFDSKTISKAYFSESEFSFIIKNEKNEKIAKFKPFTPSTLPEKIYFTSFDNFIIARNNNLIVGLETFIEPYFFSNNDSEEFSLSISFSFEGGNFGG